VVFGIHLRKGHYLGYYIVIRVKYLLIRCKCNAVLSILYR